MSQTSDTGPQGGASRALSAFFDDRGEAEAAIDRLVAAGVPRADLRLVPGEAAAPSDAAGPDDGGVLAALRNLFFPREDRDTYAEGLRRGGTLVVAERVPDALCETACDILDEKGSIDIDQRAREWRSEGWTGPEAGPVEHLGASDRQGQPRMYAETAVSALSEDPLPEAPPGGTGRRDPGKDRRAVRSYTVG